MPAALPSSFASAAAGSSNDTSTGRNASRTDSSGLSDWTRRPNGATQTFRRTSSTTNPASSSNQREANVMAASSHTQSTGAYIPPHLNANRSGSSYETRYSKDQLLELFKAQQETGEVHDSLSDIYVGDQETNVGNGMSSGRWGRRDEAAQDTSGCEICWDREGNSIPLGLLEMTENEKLAFASSVNSPLKPPNSGMAKEGTPRDGNLARKTSLSGGGLYGPLSPTNIKPGGRRRETSEPFPFPRDQLASPSSTGKANRDDSMTTSAASTLQRRKTELKELGEPPGEDKYKENLTSSVSIGTSPFGSLKRTLTGPLNVGVSTSASPWSNAPQSAGLATMGAFGSFAISGSSGTVSTASEKRPNLATLRGESRFRGLMGRDNPEDGQSAVKQKTSFGNLNRVEEDLARGDSPRESAYASQYPQSNDMDAFPESGMPVGSAALGGGFDMSPSHDERVGDFETPVRQRFPEDQSFASYGMTSDSMVYRDFKERQNQERLPNYMHSTHQHTGSAADESMSPPFTNPYQSPDQHRLRDLDCQGASSQDNPLPGLAGFSSDNMPKPAGGAFGGLGMAPPYDARGVDRNQTSSAGLNRGFPGLSGLGGLAGLPGSGPWSANLPSGTPTRDRVPFAEGSGDPLRSPIDAQPQNLARLSGNSAFSPGNAGAIGRGGRMGSLFPQAMQEQMRGSDHGRPMQDDGFDEVSERVDSPSGSHPFGGALTGASEHARADDDVYGGVDKTRNTRNPELSNFGQSYSPGPQGQINSAAFNQQPPSAGIPQTQRPQHSVGSSASSQPPTAQQKTMVMPDRIRWIYRDPQGNTQGPWSGLEMHDWYKAGFFSPELLVKKQEDADYEPLAQLIRRIGNSREPFLVPQIGIPGPPSTQPGAAWPTQTATSGSANPGPLAQPPFASSFPSFGTTLTAEQQNALERRKQEEQYLMARQKEHLAQQQVMAKQMQLQGQHGLHSQQLHHHSSAHSLHSQPSYGSITSPNGYQASPSQGPTHGSQSLPGFFDNSFRLSGPAAASQPGTGRDALGNIVEEEGSGFYERQNQVPDFQASERHSHAQQFDEGSLNDQRIEQGVSGRADLAREQSERDYLDRDSEEDAATHAERFQQFTNLRNEIDADSASEGVALDETGTSRDQHRYELPYEQQAQLQSSQQLAILTLTEQVQKAASADQSPGTSIQSPWAKVDHEHTQLFLPPQSSSPLPAPAAQRNRQNVADALTAESLTQSASAETPSASVAPWAKELADGPKQPSLREIQEAEARKAAKQEELISAARRAALGREIANQALPAAPGLPSSSTWGSSETVSVVPVPTTSPWMKSATNKSAGNANSSSKKTLQQIQKEEEALARKQKAAASNGSGTNAGAGVAQAVSAGKRYADLASKAAAAAPATGGAWTTVGAGGKTKPLITPTASVAGARSVSSNAVATVAASTRSRPVLSTTRSSTVASAQHNAQEEFKKWAIAELRPDLNKGIHVEDFVLGLFSLPSEMEIITEAVHGVSQTMDSRHFAEEFIRRRKLADKGMVESSAGSAATSAPGSETKSGGWSEVAKKGPVASQRDDSNAFKVVAAKGKRGGKK